MTEHPDCTYCPQCREVIPVCRWDGQRLVTMCHGAEPMRADELLWAAYGEPKLTNGG